MAETRKGGPKHDPRKKAKKKRVSWKEIGIAGFRSWKAESPDRVCKFLVLCLGVEVLMGQSRRMTAQTETSERNWRMGTWRWA